MTKFAHIIYMPVTGVGIWGKKSDEWLAYRIEIMKKYTLQSLVKQTNRSFLVWMSFRPEEENHPLIKELGEYLHKIKLPTIMTFHGLMYWDDKFSSGLKNRLANTYRIIRQAWREKDPAQYALIPKLFERKNQTLPQRLEKGIYELRKLKEFQDANYIYLTRLDSDDMLHHEAVAEIQGMIPKEGALVYGMGYVYNSITKKMALWNPKTNPPFHTIIFLGTKFFNPLEHLEYFKDFRSHEDITRIFETRKLPDFRYCVLVHENHISTFWNHQFRGPEVDSNLINDFI